MKKKSVLVTGGEGFLGSYLVRYLQKRTDGKIVVFDKLSQQSVKPKDGIVHLAGDILSNDDISRVFASYGPFTTVYHLASAMPNKAMPDNMVWKTNVEGIKNLASESVKHRVPSFIFTSSNVTYGVSESLPVTEETLLRPIEIYGKSKAQAEKELEHFKEKMNIQIFRCPVITGIGRLGLQAILFEFISENRNVYVLGDGRNIYQFADALDICDALERASHKKGFDIYTIGGDGIMPLCELYQRVIKSAHSTSKIISLPKAPAIFILSILDKLNISPLGIYQYSMIFRSMYADTTKIKKKLGWKPKKTNLESFLENYEWYIQNKEHFVEMGSGLFSDNRSLPKMGIFKLLKILS